MPLASDLNYPLELSESGLANWLDTAWVLIKSYQSRVGRLRRLEATGLPTFTAPQHNITIRGEGGIAGVGELHGYPLTSTFEETVYWPPTMWAYLTLDIERWNSYTRQHIVNIISKHELIPVRIGGGLDYSKVDRMDELMPVFESYDHNLMRAPFSFASLAELWGMSERGLKRHLATYGNRTEHTLWRGLAHSLRYVGVVYMGKTAIPTWHRHWYHATSFEDECFHAQPIELTKVGDMEVILKPFVKVPVSCNIESLPRNLADVQGEEVFMEAPLVQWNTTGIAKGSSVNIVGWTRMLDQLADIILMRTSPQAKVLYLTADGDYGTLHGRRYNAVIQPGDPVAQTEIPTVALKPGGQALLK
jgi:hypothetical protein